MVGTCTSWNSTDATNQGLGKEGGAPVVKHLHAGTSIQFHNVCGQFSGTLGSSITSPPNYNVLSLQINKDGGGGGHVSPITSSGHSGMGSP